jgi:tRNA pseudouridine32 synthase/23S rRNA pseudouridine746 synthase
MSDDEPPFDEQAAAADARHAERERRKRTLPDWQEPTILHRDGMILIIDKPFGLPAHPGPNPRGQRLLTLSDYLEGFRFGLPRKPEAAHRLDKDTSGCLVLGRHPKALKLLNDLFRDGKVAKTYWAVVEGAPEADEGVIDKPLAKLNPDRGWWMRVDDNGLPSVTRWKVLGRGENLLGQPLTFLELSPETGRTHQLRVHCQSMDWPILGDPIYGKAAREGGPGLHLHARALTIPLFRNKPAISVTAPVPPHMRAALMRAGWSGLEPASQDKPATDSSDSDNQPPAAS